MEYINKFMGMPVCLYAQCEWLHTAQLHTVHTEMGYRLCVVCSALLSRKEIVLMPAVFCYTFSSSDSVSTQSTQSSSRNRGKLSGAGPCGHEHLQWSPARGGEGRWNTEYVGTFRTQLNITQMTRRYSFRFGPQQHREGQF